MVRKIAAIAGLGLLAFFAWGAAIAVTAYFESPKLVARQEATGLTYDPAALPPSRLCALLLAQDPTFFEHHGIGLTAGKPGHTTITQSIGKFLFFENFRPGVLRFRKIQLMFASIGLDRRIPKSVQLRIFLNRTYFGTHENREVLGFPDAAQTYFGRSLGQLSDAQYFSLLAMLDGPNQYHVIRAPEVNQARARGLEQQARARCARPTAR